MIEKARETNLAATVDVAATEAYKYILEASSFEAVMEHIGEYLGQLDAETFESLIELGEILYGVDDANERDLSREGSAFVDGALLGMYIADFVAETVGVDLFSFREHMKETRNMPGLDIEQGSLDDARDLIAMRIRTHKAAFSGTNIPSVIYDILEKSDFDSDIRNIVESGITYALGEAKHSIDTLQARREFEHAIEELSVEGALERELGMIPVVESGVQSGGPWEVIPEGFEKPYDLVDEIDPKLVADYMKGRLFSGVDVAKEIKRLHVFNKLVKPELLTRLIEMGRYLEPINEELIVTDMELSRARAFASASALALGVLDILSQEVRGTRSEWRTAWTNLSRTFDFPDKDLVGNVNTRDDCETVAKKLMALGHKQWDKLPKEYQQMVYEIEERYPEIIPQSNVFEASFAYVFAYGKAVLTDLAHGGVEEETIAAIVPSEDEIDRMVIQLLTEEGDGGQ